MDHIGSTLLEKVRAEDAQATQTQQKNFGGAAVAEPTSKNNDSKTPTEQLQK